MFAAAHHPDRPTGLWPRRRGTGIADSVRPQPIKDTGIRKGIEIGRSAVGAGDADGLLIIAAVELGDVAEFEVCQRLLLALATAWMTLSVRRAADDAETLDLGANTLVLFARPSRKYWIQVSRLSVSRRMDRRAARYASLSLP